MKIKKKEAEVSHFKNLRLHFGSQLNQFTTHEIFTGQNCPCVFSTKYCIFVSCRILVSFSIYLSWLRMYYVQHWCVLSWQRKLKYSFRIILIFSSFQIIFMTMTMTTTTVMMRKILWFISSLEALEAPDSRLRREQGRGRKY